MKILITGASGLLGRSIYKKLKIEKNLSVMGTAFSRTRTEYTKLDLLDKKVSSSFIIKSQADLIIHCAAERRPDICKANPLQAEQLNVHSVETISTAASEIGANVLYISTDYVFDGQNPPYRAEDKANPLNFYGKMKLAGEKILKDILEKPIILRVPMLYGPVEYLGESSVTQIAEKILKQEHSRHDHTAIRYPTHTDDVACVISRLVNIMKKGSTVEGILHWSSESPFTKYDMARLMAEILNISDKNIAIAEAETETEPRPLNSHLNIDRLKEMGIEKESSFTESLKEILLPHL